MTSIKYSFLYCFQNEYMTLVEIKRTDLPEDSTPEQVYSWLVINPQTAEYKKLGFKSMGTEMVNGNLINIRVFNEGELRFDGLFAKFVYGPNSHLLENKSSAEPSKNIADIVSTYLD
ncbi:MAG: hypothetical protein ACOVP4_00635 [Bacteriovoracaceae bacterium]